MTEDSNIFGVFVEERVATFIDGQSVYAACRQLEFDIDYIKINRHLALNSRFLRSYFYTPMNQDPEAHNPLRRIVDMLDYNGVNVVCKPVKEFTDEEGRRREKTSIAVDLAVNMFELADKIDHMILFSGDGIYRSVVESIKRKGVKVTVISTHENSGNSMIADELRRESDAFIDLKTLRDSGLFNLTRKIRT